MSEADENTGTDDEEKIVEFPTDDIRMPTQRLPRDLGRIEDSHPLRKPLRIAIVVLGIFIMVVIVYAFITTPPADREEPGFTSFAESYREPGTITYLDRRIDGWFLEESREHFMDQDGNRYTYVDSHMREGFRVIGHWRLIE